MATHPHLGKKTLSPLPLGQIQPRGWLQGQLRIQASGLSGHLDEFWNDVANSGWIGGDADGWERAPYWLDGLVPLAYTLDDEKLKAKVQRWLDYILEHQHEDGWLGPLRDKTHGYLRDPWPTFIILKVLTQYQEASNDSRVIPAMERSLHCLQEQLQQQPLTSWASMRAADLLLSIYWLYERTQASWLLTFAHTVQQQSFNWSELYRNFPEGRQLSWTLENHVVNHAMALKEPAITARITQNPQAHAEVMQRIHTLDTYHGQATGVFSGDEILAGPNPSQGTELCSVVEYLFSLEQLLAIFGDPTFADRLERIAYNALPATFKPDMWAHQYDQQANQVVCMYTEERVYTTNGPDANLFGLEPHFGCCTANMHQGWPKLTSHLWMKRTDEEALVALAYAPCAISTQVAGNKVQIEVETNYPFEERIHITIRSEQQQKFPIFLRIPQWAEHASMEIDGAQESLQSGTFQRVEREWGTSTTISLHFPMPLKTQRRYHNSITLERGPFVYALKINEDWRQVAGELPHADWEVHPTSPWNYALEINQAHPEESVQIYRADNVGDNPFSPEGAPIHLHVQGRRIPEWGLERGAAASVPASPVSSTEPHEQLTLIPYGCTNLRVTEFPTLTE